MDQFVYTIMDRSMAHAYKAVYKSKDSYKPKTSSDSYNTTKAIAGRKLTTHRTNPYGNYKSPYYDPVERHERYEREKDHVTRPYGVGLSESKSSGKSRSGSSKKGSGKSRSGSSKKGSGKSAKKNLTDVIAKLREESATDTEVQREVSKRKIADLKAQLKKHLSDLASQNKGEETLNILEIRGKIQEIRNQIESEGKNLQDWISHEREALQRRIAKVKGENYDAKKKDDTRKQNVRKQTVKERADAIYKSKSSK